MMKTTAATAVAKESLTQIPMSIDFRRHCDSAGALSPHMNNVLLELVKSYGDQLHCAHVLGNLNETDQSQFPSGTALFFNRDAPVNTMSLNGDSISALVMSKIVLRKDERLDDSFFLERLQKLQSAVPQYSEAPITLQHMDPRSYSDSDHWREELGTSGSVGVSKTKINAKNNAYYLWAMCSTPILGQQVVDNLKAKTTTTTTWSEFAKDPRTIYWRNSVMRNAARVLYSTAQQLGVMIRTEHEYDTYMETPDQAPHVVADLEAEGSVRQFVSDICPVQTPGTGRDAIGQFIQCAPVSKLTPSKYCLVAESPYQGFTGVRMQPNDINMRNASVFPTTTGRRVASAALDFTEKALPKHEIQDIDSQYIWEGKPEKLTVDRRSMNDRLHPGAFRCCDQEFLRTQFFEHGIKNSIGVTEQFTPVIAKVANRKQRSSTTTK